MYLTKESSAKPILRSDPGIKHFMKLLTTQEAADILEVTPARVRAMILAGRLPAEKFGHVHMIREEDLKLVAHRKPGRPKKTAKRTRKTTKKSP